MTSRDFCFWLQGYFEIRAANNQSEDSITPVQIEVITKHLALVFKHEIDPSMGPPKHQEELNEIHAGELKISPELEKRFEDMRKELMTAIALHRPSPGGGLMRC